MSAPGDIYHRTLAPSHRGLDLLAIRYVLIPEQSPIIREEELDFTRWTKVTTLQYTGAHPGTVYWLIRNENALPPAWFVGDISILEASVVYETIESGAMPGGATFDPRAVALVHEGQGSQVDLALDQLSAARDCGGVSLEESSVRRKAYRIDGQAGCFLVLSEVFYPWWRASVDGVPAELLRIDGGLMDLAVPTGSSRVHLDLRPTTVFLGLTVSAFSLFAWIVICIVSEWRARRGHQSRT